MRKFFLRISLVFLWLGFTGGSTSYAAHSKNQDQPSFCSQYVQARQSKSSGQTSVSTQVSFLFHYFFARSKLLSQVELGNDHGDSESSMVRLKWKRIKTYSVGAVLDPELHLAYRERERGFLKRAEGFSLRFKDVETLEACEQAIRGADEELRALEAEFQALQRDRLVRDDYQNGRMQSIVRRKMKQVETQVDVDRLTRGLRDEEAPTVLLVLHSDENGVLYDSYFNQIPRSVFENMSSNVRKLLIYSCHAAAVTEWYRFERLARDKSLEIVLPKITSRYEPIFGQTVPIGLVHHFARKNARVEKRPAVQMNPESRACRLRSDHSYEAIGIWLNRRFIGVMKADVIFPCSFLTVDNSIHLQRINFRSIAVPRPSDRGVRLVIEGVEVRLVNHFDGRNEYLGSKATFSVVVQ